MKRLPVNNTSKILIIYYDPWVVATHAILVFIVGLWLDGYRTQRGLQFAVPKIGTIKVCSELGGLRGYWRPWNNDIDYDASFGHITKPLGSTSVRSLSSTFIPAEYFEHFHMNLWVVNLVHSSLDGWYLEFRDLSLVLLCVVALGLRVRASQRRKSARGFDVMLE